MILHVNNYTTRDLKERDCLVLFCVDEEGNVHRLDIEDERLTPRFYILEEDKKFLDQAKAVMKDKIVGWEDCPTRDRFGRKMITVYVKKKYDVYKARSFFPRHYQASIEWHKMAMIELGLEEWIDADLSQKKYGFIPIEAVKPAEDPGWEWKDRCCWIDTEWDARDLDHVPRWSEAAYSKCFLICCYDDAENEGAMFSLRDSEEYEIVDLETRMGEKVGLDKTIKVKRYRCTSEEDLLKKWIDWFSGRKFTSISGHNISGGWVVGNNGRSWRNGFDLPLLHERCLHLGIDDSKLSPLGKVKIRKNDSRYNIYINGTLVFDWLYAWKFSGYWRERHKTVITEDGEERDVRLRGNGLDNLGLFFFDEGKARTMDDLKRFYPGHPDFPIDEWQVWTLHDYFPDLSEFYCWIDVILSCSLDRLHNVKKDITSVACLCGAPPGDAMLATRYHKVLTYRRLKDKMILESDLLNMGGKGKQGAFVYAGKPGLWKWGVCIDVVSMYPSIFLTTNAGVDTIIEPQRTVWNKDGLFIENKGGDLYRFDELIFTPSGAIYHKREISVDREIFQEFGDERNRLKRLRDEQEEGTLKWMKYESAQKRVKVCMNSRFGIAPVDIFNTATVTGKYILKKIVKFLEKEVVNGDTDGLQPLVEADNLEEALVKGREITKRVNEYIEELVKEFGADENFLHMKMEGVFDRILVHSKKMYMMRLLWKDGHKLDEPEYVFKGFKIKRSDSSQAMDDLFNESVDVILDSENLKKAKYKFVNFLREWHSKFKTFSPMYISITKSLSKYVDEYKNTFESRAAKFTKEYFEKEYLPGETFNILSLSQTPAKINGKDVLKSHVTPNAVIAFDRLHMHFLEDMKIDWKEMELKTISCIKPFMELLDIKYWKAVIRGGLFR